MSINSHTEAENLIATIDGAEDSHDPLDRLVEQTATVPGEPFDPGAQDRLGASKGNGAAFAVAVLDERGEATEETDPSAASAEDVAAEVTLKKAELFAWADSVLGLDEAELELALDAAAKRFERPRATLHRIIKARQAEQSRDRTRRPAGEDRPEDGVRYYGTDFKVSNRGVFACQIGKDGSEAWEQISTTRVDLLALTRDTREENWGTYVLITNRDGGTKTLAIPHALTAADKTVGSRACSPRSGSAWCRASGRASSLCSF